jgi:hypothetical protein
VHLEPRRPVWEGTHPRKRERDVQGESRRECSHTAREATEHKWNGLGRSSPVARSRIHSTAYHRSPRMPKPQHPRGVGRGLPGVTGAAMSGLRHCAVRSERQVCRCRIAPAGVVLWRASERAPYRVDAGVDLGRDGSSARRHTSATPTSGVALTTSIRAHVEEVLIQQVRACSAAPHDESGLRPAPQSRGRVMVT